MNDEQLLKHRELEFLRACYLASTKGGRGRRKAREAARVRMLKLVEARKRAEKRK